MIQSVNFWEIVKNHNKLTLISSSVLLKTTFGGIILNQCICNKFLQIYIEMHIHWYWFFYFYFYVLSDRLQHDEDYVTWTAHG